MSYTEADLRADALERGLMLRTGRYPGVSGSLVTTYSFVDLRAAAEGKEPRLAGTYYPISDARAALRALTD